MVKPVLEWDKDTVFNEIIYPMMEGVPNYEEHESDLRNWLDKHGGSKENVDKLVDMIGDYSNEREELEGENPSEDEEQDQLDERDAEQERLYQKIVDLWCEFEM